MADIKEYEGLTAIEALNFFRNQHHNDGNATEAGIMANAINELLPKLAKISHIKLIDFTVDYGRISERDTAAFDDRRISEAEVTDFIRTAHDTYNQHIVVMSRKQADSLFGKEESGT